MSKPSIFRRGKAPWGKHEDTAPPGLARLAVNTDTPFGKKLAAKPKVKRPTETQRVVRLSERDYSSADKTAKYAKPGCTWKLRPIQSQALAALEDVKGGLFSIGVGWGKTLIGMLAAHAVEAKFTIFLSPASTIDQLKEMHAELRKQFKIGPIDFISYGRLSRPDGTNLLDSYMTRLRPGEVVLVCDEVHKIKRKESARTKRVIRFLRDHPGVKVVGMSGTLTSKGLKDMVHIAEMALRDNSPIPRDRYHINAWAECIDVDGQPGDSDWNVITPLWRKYHEVFIYKVRYRDRRQMARAAFQKRFRSAPGVVCSEEGALGCSLEIGTQDIVVPARIREALDMALDEEATPDGDPFIDDSAEWRTMRQLSCGFYYKWDWPNGEPDEDWLDARSEWSRCVRRELLYSAREGYDSPLLVANAVAREVLEGRRTMLHRAWLGWFGTRMNEKPPPPTVAVWIDDYLVRDAVEWARQQTEPVILWYQSKAIEDKLKKFGIKVYGAGNNPPKEGHLCAMSIRAHGVGKNLQHGWSIQLVLEPPSSGNVWEQLLGRTHRPGQTADSVSFSVYQHTDSFENAVSSAREDARYIQDTTGSRQKLVYGTYTGGFVG